MSTLEELEEKRKELWLEFDVLTAKYNRAKQKLSEEISAVTLEIARASKASEDGKLG